MTKSAGKRSGGAQTIGRVVAAAGFGGMLLALTALVVTQCTRVPDTPSAAKPAENKTGGDAKRVASGTIGGNDTNAPVNSSAAAPGASATAAPSGPPQPVQAGNATVSPPPAAATAPAASGASTSPTAAAPPANPPAGAPATVAAAPQPVAAEQSGPQLKLDREFRSIRYAVFFTFASSRLGESGRATVAHLVPEARQADKIVLTGRTDSSGDPKLNEKLAQRRADSVKQAFAHRGVKPALVTTQIDVSGSTTLDEGTVTPLFPKIRELRARRVDIHIEAPKQPAR